MTYGAKGRNYAYKYSCVNIVERHVPELDIRYYYLEHKEPGKFKEDDFLDAFAGAVMLYTLKRQLKEMPDGEDCEVLQMVNRQGVKMRIVYIEPDA